MDRKMIYLKEKILNETKIWKDFNKHVQGETGRKIKKGEV